MTVEQVIEILETAERQGAGVDEPEGARDFRVTIFKRARNIFEILDLGSDFAALDSGEAERAKAKYKVVIHSKDGELLVEVRGLTLKEAVGYLPEPYAIPALRLAIDTPWWQ